jgi:hypothetical protein
VFEKLSPLFVFVFVWVLLCDLVLAFNTKCISAESVLSWAFTGYFCVILGVIGHS